MKKDGVTRKGNKRTPEAVLPETALERKEVKKLVGTSRGGGWGGMET